MRILFTATPLIGHLFPMMPLARCFRDRGHDVLVASGGAAVAAVADDIDAVDIAPGIGNVRAVAQGLGLHPVLAVRSMTGRADPRGGAHVFAVTNKPMIAPLTRTAERFQPDLVVHEPFAAAAAIVAARIGVPTVLHNIALDNGTLIRRELLRLLCGRDEPAAATTLSLAPPSIVSVPGWPLRYTPYAPSGAPVPPEFHDPPVRPRIVVTRSTMLGDGPDAMLRAVLRAAPQVDADIVIVRPNRAIASSARLPRNVHTVGWIALHRALPTCTAMVNHGGAGSVLAALRAGIPQLATPAPGDRRWNAESVENRGAGLSVPASKITAAHLDTLITDADLTRSARAVAAEIAAMPTVEDTADRLLAAHDVTRA
ncbi:glycosyltransferase [Nocardia jiangxiensis]|uniref:glycosyltransferase n=1 Tax=Nocardia jiangxiensis TaxID=282685 RepID=UPI00031A4344|nr:glycosyltransferase [Nocardia jiangxiensis]